jgi:hypothetical protein
MATKAALLREYAERLGKLRTVTAFTRAVALECAQVMLTADQLAWHLGRVLPLVERFIEPFPLPELPVVCSRLRGADFPTLAAYFEMEQEFSPIWWALANFKWFQVRDLPRILLASANHYALPFLEVHQHPLLFNQVLNNLGSVFALDFAAQDGVGMYEHLLGWDGGAYQDRGRLRQTLRALSPDKFLFLGTVTTLIDLFIMACRYADASQVFYAALGLADRDEPSAERLLKAHAAILAEPTALSPMPELGPDLAHLLEASFIGSLVQVLRHHNPELGAAVVECYAGHPAGRSDPAAVARTLGSRSGRPLTGRPAELFLAQYAACLNKLDRPADAVRVMETALGVTADAYADGDRLAQCLASFQGAFHPADGGWYFLGLFATALRHSGRPADSAAVIEAGFAGRGAGDRLTRALRAAQARVQDSFTACHAVGAIASWVRSLREAGRPAEARRVAWATLGGLAWLTSRRGQPQGHLSNLLIGVWELLDLAGAEQLTFAHTLCERVIALLRTSIGDVRVAAADRREFHEDNATIRHRIVRVGLDAVMAAAPADRPRRWEEVLAWDAELGQRTLLERILEGAPTAPAGPPPDLPRLVAGPPPGPPPERLRNLCFGRAAEAGPRPIRPRPARGGRADAADLARQLATGIGPADLARGLGPSERLLRVGFAADGRLVWAVLAAAGGGLRVLADGAGRPGDQADLAAAAARHDAELELVWLPGRFAAHPDGPARFAAAAAAFRPALLELREHVAAASPHAPDAWEEVLATADRYLPGPDLAPVRDGLRRGFRGYFQPPAADAGPWVADRLADLGRLDQLLTWPANAAAVRQRLDAPTAAFLAAAARVCPADCWLAGLAPETDLLIQVDDVLHAVPIPYLPARGGRLFQAVRSTRAALSTVLNGWLAGRDRRPAPGPGGRGLVLSWFAPGDEAAVGAQILDQDLAADAGGWEWRVAAGADGTHAVLAAAASSPLPLAVVCGHGHAAPPGVRLGDGVWGGARVFRPTGGGWEEGPGGDLSEIDFLLQVSCSIGRVQHGQGQDVAGFCVETAAAGGRAVLAGKWPIAAAEAPRFAARVAAAYRALRAAGGDCLRARAVAAARRHFLNDPTAVGLNTAAAFDLYGLG